MVNSRRLTIGITVFGIGGAVLALSASEVRDELEKVGIPDRVFSASIYVGILIMLAGLIIAFLSCQLPERPIVHYEFRRMRRKEMKTLVSFSKRFLDQVPTVNQVKEIYTINPNTIWVAEREAEYPSGRVKTETVGFFSIIPLTAKAVQLLNADRLDAFHFTQEHISPPKQKPAGYYIGSIAAKGFKAKAEILGYVRGQVEGELRRATGVVFTRPVTRDGLRLAKNYGFQPVSENVGSNELGRIYQKTYEQDAETPPVESEKREPGTTNNME